jgi:hypothetical protein
MLTWNVNSLGLRLRRVPGLPGELAPGAELG